MPVTLGLIISIVTVMNFKIALTSALATLTISSVIASDDVETTVAESVIQLASNADPVESARSIASNKLDSSAEELVSGWVPNAEVSIEGLSKGKPTFSILTVNPLHESNDLKHTVFNQTSLFSEDGRQTLNIGFGYRNMSDDQNWLLGINGFYDHEFPYGHQRSSVGLEARSSVLEFNANRYYAISGWKSGNDSFDEKALGGYDYELGFAVPYMPGAKIYRKQFLWDAQDGVADLKGSTTSLAINGNILVPGLGLEVGATDYNAGATDTNFVRLTFKYPPSATEQKMFSSKAFEFTSMKEHRLDKVRRENKIVKQTAIRVTVSGY